MRYRVCRFATPVSIIVLIALTGSMGLHTHVTAQTTKADEQRKAQQPPSQNEPDESIHGQLKVFTEVLSYLETNYVDGLHPKAIMYGAIRGLMRIGDPEGAYIPPEIYKEMQSKTKEQLAGLGLEITFRDDRLLVVTSIEDGPAFRAGIQLQDHIAKMDGVSTKGMTVIDAMQKLGGLAGTPMTLSILREGMTEPQDVTLTREFMVMQTVNWKRLQGDIGYIRLRSFHKTTADELESALQKLDEKNLWGLVLDLRNNAGELFEQVLAVADRFLEGGKLIVFTQGRLASQNKKGFSTNKAVELHYPIIVLVNKGSAAGAEIVAGALQDLERALILGTPTFGKGTIQTIISLSSGAGLRVTTARYFTPKGHSIHERGIISDISVELPKPKSDTEGKKESGGILPPGRNYFGDLKIDRQLQRAVEILQTKK